ncbi:MAG: MBL fold metallo-hydrolase [Nocardioidaceae bacterium]|nr:MBL fold metallo-hydrolase [Nocardioidaceae bacterium]
MRLTHLGHSCLLVEVGDHTRILIDPGSFSHGLESLTGLDAIVVTHQHPDHCDLERLPELVANNPDALVAAEPQTAEQVAEQTGGRLRPQPLATGETVSVGDAQISPVGDLHAFNNEWMPRVGNLGVVVSAEGEPTLFHPGDAYDAEPGPVDVLALPINAPWTAVRDTLTFVRRIAPRFAVPIHDALLAEAGRRMYLGHVLDFGPDGMEVRDLHDGRPAEFGVVDS